MKAFSGILSGAYASWAYAKSLCCMPLSNNNTEKARHHGNEKSFVVIQDEPSLVPPPSMGPSRALREGRTQERAPRKRRHGSGWSSFSVRSRLLPNASSSSRRPLISGPYNFRHLHSESFRFPEEEPQTRPRPSSFRPLELGILAHDNQLSPILPHFDNPSPPVTPPPRAYLHSSPSDDSYTISHQRSNSSMSFHIPRRPVAGGSVFDSPRSDVDTPQRPQPARMRAHTSPETPSTIMEDLVERVANAMMERDRLQEQLDDIIERQSIYASSRPSTAHGQPEMEPMPDIPALPPDAPSFSERLSTDRPRTAPSKMPTRVIYQANSSRKVESRVPPPPLPLRLRPPLRKKKSFSRVSTWLFPGGEHQRDISLDSITNLPKPVTGAEGFYQVAQLGPSRRSSLDTVSPVSEWGTEEKTVPTSWSPGSDKTIKAIIAETPITPVLGCREPISRPPRRSVGVAF